MYKHFKIYEGFDAISHTLLGVSKKIVLSSDKYKQLGKLSQDYAISLDRLSDEKFKALIITTIHQIKLKRYDNARYVGVIAQAVKRVFGITPHIEQLMGVHSLIDSHIIQMYTGEGKTLTASMSAIYKSWKSGNCHVVTSNDYLAQRDAMKMEVLFEYCNLDVGFVIGSIDPSQRKEIYEKKIVYSTSKELLADYLRDSDDFVFDRYPTEKIIDNLIKNNKRVMRGLDSVIIDEADSVLVDEATVPLIIASQTHQPFFHEALVSIYNISKRLQQDIDYITNTKHKEISLTAIGKDKYKKYINEIPTLWQTQNKREHLIKQILVAKHFYHKNINYIVKDDKIVIIDDKTGRIMESRSWGGALHQAIEIKESVTLTQMTHTHKKMSFQFFFRLYKDMCGMSGTLQNIENEIWSIYEKQIIKIPPHAIKKVIYKDEIICNSIEEKWEVVCNEAISEAQKNKAVLVGTKTIQDSQLLYEMIQKEYQNVIILNANYQEIEAKIISKAGTASKITIATNIAGRGTDIITDDVVRENGGLHVIATSRDTSKRVDMQLYGRTGRQGEVGSIISIISLQDEIFEKHSPKILSRILKLILKTKFSNIISKYANILQFYSEKSLSRVRKNIFKNDIKTIKRMSFTNI